MQQPEQIRLLKQIMKHIDEGTNVDAGGIRHNPSWVYTCSDLAEKEWQTFYRDYPQVIGASNDLPGPGTFMTTSDFGTPVLATRDSDGKFRAAASHNILVSERCNCNGLKAQGNSKLSHPPI